MHQKQRALAAALAAIALLAGYTLAARADTPSYYYPPHFAPNGGQVKPIYPDSARAAREVGVVKIKVLVASNGVPKSFSIFQSSGHKDLDQAVLAACKASKYVPAMRGSTPLTAFYDVSYKFDLQGVEENQGSIGDLQSKVDANPHDSTARVQLADLLLTQQPPDYVHAESTLRAGTSIDSSNANLWSRLGLAYYNDGIASNDTSKFKSSVDAFDKALAINPNSDLAKTAAAAYFRYAFDLQNAGQAASALPYAQKAVKLDPKQYLYRMLVGEDEVSLGQTQAAVSDFTAASQLDDHKAASITARLLSELGNAQLMSGDRTDGMASITKAMDIAPNSPFPYQAKYSYFLSQSDYPSALGPLQQLITIQPKEAQWQTALGDIYLNMQNWPNAQAAYAKAVALNPTSGDAQLGTAKVAAAQGKTDQIAAPLAAAVQASPASASLYNTVIARILLNASKDKNDYSADALKYAKAGTDADPNNPDAWVTYAIACADQKQKDTANDALHKAYTLFKAQNNTAGVTQVVNYYKSINGTDMPGVDHTDASNRASGPG